MRAKMPSPPRPAATLRRWPALAGLGLALLLPGLLLACQLRRPDKAGGKPVSAAPGQAGPSAAAPAQKPPPEYPRECTGYLLAALAQPTEGYPALGASWALIASLPGVDQAPSCAELRGRIGAAVREAGGNPPPELVAAWLSTHPGPAADWLGQKLAGGGERYLGALIHHPEQRALLAKLDLSKASEPGAAMILELLRHWGQPEESDTAVLTLLSARQEPGLSLRACGWLLRLDPSNASALVTLRAGIREAAKGGAGPSLAAAAEGARISGISALAGDFVPWLVGTSMGEEEAGSAPTPKQAYASYAVSLLGGADGAATCSQLLKAKAPELRWKGRLGLLLAGKPDAWETARRAQGVEQRLLWLALEPLEVKSPLLLPTYAAAAKSKDAHTRGSAALQLGRYSNIEAESADYALLRDSLTALTQAAETPVAAQAWKSAGGVQLGGLEAAAAALLASADAAPELKLAACEYLLRRAAK